MTIQELHIGLDQELRKMNTNVFGALLPEEKDWIIYQSTLKFIKTRTNPRSNSRGIGFQASLKRYDDLEELITPGFIPVYRYDSSSVYGILPRDYYQSIGFSANVAWDCDDLTLISSSNNAYYAVVPFPAPASTSNIFAGFKIQLTDFNNVVTTIFNLNDYPGLSNGVSDATLYFDIVNLIIDVNRTNQDIEIWWEKWHNVYVPNSFIIVTKSNQQFLNTHSSVTLTTNLSTSGNIGFSNTSFTRYGNTAPNSTDSPVDIVKTEDADAINSFSFGKTKHTRPNATLFSGYIRVYHTKRFILNSVTADYIRKPRHNSIVLNRTCELNPRVHDEVIALAAQVAYDYLTQRRTVPTE